MPIFWGPNQRILEDDKYVEPEGWKFNETLTPPFVVRFIHDSGTVDSDSIDGVEPGGGGPGDPGVWELYLIQTTVVIEGTGFIPPALNVLHLGADFTVFPCLPFGSEVTVPGVVIGNLGGGGYAYPDGLNTTSHLMVPNLNPCDEFVAGNYIATTAAGFIGLGVFRIKGYLIWFNWRKNTGPGAYDYYTASNCGSIPSGSVFLDPSPRTTPIYQNEFPFGYNPGAPVCPFF